MFRKLGLLIAITCGITWGANWMHQAARSVMHLDQPYETAPPKARQRLDAYFNHVQREEMSRGKIACAPLAVVRIEPGDRLEDTLVSCGNANSGEIKKTLIIVTPQS